MIIISYYVNVQETNPSSQSYLIICYDVSTIDIEIHLTILIVYVIQKTLVSVENIF